MANAGCSLDNFVTTHDQIKLAFLEDQNQMSEALVKVSSLAHAISKTENNKTLRSNFKYDLHLEDGKINVENILQSILGTKNWKALLKESDDNIITEINTRMDEMLKLAVRAGAKPAEFTEDSMLADAFMDKYKSFLYAENTERGFEKFFSGQWLRGFMTKEMDEDFDGVIVQKDKSFRREPVLDSKRSSYKHVVDGVEISIKDLSDKVSRIFADNPGKELNPAQANELLKYMSKDITDRSAKDYQDPYYELKAAMRDDFQITEPSRVEQAVKDLEKVYETWRKINYGVSGKIETTEDYTVSDKPGMYNPRDHEDSVLGFMWKTGDAIVEQLVNSNLSYNQLHETQRFFLEKFGDSNKDAIEKKWPGKITLDLAKIKKGYVPMSKTTEITELIETMSQKDIFKNVETLSPRNRVHDESDPFQDSTINNLELFRYVATDVSLYTFAKEVKNHVDLKADDSGYNQWKNDRGEGHYEMEDGVFQRYHKYILQRFENRTKPEHRNQSTTFQNVKKWMIAMMSLQGTMPLMDSALNNVIQAVIGRFNTIGWDQYRTMSKSLNESETSNDPAMRKLFAVVNSLTKNKTKGRNAGFVIHDTDITANTKALKVAFGMAEGAMRYGHLAPIAIGLKGIKLAMGKDTDTSFLKDKVWASMSGSEQWIRNFKSNVVMNHIAASYKAQKLDGLDMEGKSQEQLTQWVKDIMKKNQHYYSKLDQELHGDFTKDTKPFSAYKLGDAESTKDLLVGLAAAQFQMFRQATMFGMLGSVGSMAKSVASVKGGMKTGKISAAANAGTSIILMDAMYEYYSDMFADNPIRFSALNAVNQIDPLVGGFEFLHAMIAPMFDAPVTQKQYDTITEKLVRFGAGMTRGTLSEDESDLPIREQFASMLNIAKVFGKTMEPLTLTYDMLTEGVTSGNSAKFKERMRNRGTGIAPIDNIVGPGNDFIRLFLKTVHATSAVISEGGYGEKKKQAYLRTNSIKSLILGKIGFGIYTFDNTVNLRTNNVSSKITQNNLYSRGVAGQIDDREVANSYMNIMREEDTPYNHMDGN